MMDQTPSQPPPPPLPPIPPVRPTTPVQAPVVQQPFDTLVFLDDIVVIRPE